MSALFQSIGASVSEGVWKSIATLVEPGSNLEGAGRGEAKCGLEVCSARIAASTYQRLWDAGAGAVPNETF